MNILFLSREYFPNHNGGVGTYVYEMARLLVKMNHGVFIITEESGRSEEYSGQGIRVFRVRPEKNFFLNGVRTQLKDFIDRLEYSYAVSAKIKEIVSQYTIDIVESCDARTEGFWYYLFKRKPPLVIKLHTPESIVYALNQESHSKDRRLIERLEEWWIHRAKRLIGPSNAIVNLAAGYYRINPQEIPVAPNPIDLDFFKPAASFRKNYTVLYAGRLEFRKGPHILIRAIPYVLEKIPQAKFIFIGSDCGMKSYILDKIKQYSIQDYVELVDKLPREELIGYYQNSALCVLPSLWENHPYAVLEAMACGRPVIAGNAGGIPEIIEDKFNGRLVAAGSSLDLAETIIDSLANQEATEKLGRNARRYMEEKYSPQAIAEINLKIYEELLEQGVIPS